MNAAPSEPKPTAALVIERDETLSIVLEALEALAASTSYGDRMLAITAKRAAVLLRSERDEARGRAEALAAERDELANWIKRIHGQAEAAQAVIRGQKLTADLEVAPTA